MLSRVADSFYWMSRYLERAEHSARVLEVHQSLTLDDPTDMVGRSLLVAVGAVPAATADSTSEAVGRIAAAHLATVASAVVSARENARQIREQISSEMWEQLNLMYLTIRDADGPEAPEAAVLMRRTIAGAHRFYGVTEATLSHGEGWHHMQLGRYLERASSTASLLELYFDEPPEGEGRSASINAYVERVGLLRACAAFEAYCRCYTADIRPERLAEFLVLNAEFPQSVRFAADRLEDSLRAIARSLGRQQTGRPERFAGRLRAALNFGTIDEIMADNVVRYLASIRKQCGQIHTALYQPYISYPIETAIAR